MKVAYIKNVVIWALVAINLFFLSYYLIGRYQDNTIKLQMRKEIALLMAQNGIDLDTDNIHEGGELYLLDTNRDSDKEQAIVESFLGQTTVVEQGGIITNYNGKNGQAVFRNSGEFELAFEPGVNMTTASIAAMTRQLLEKMELETSSVTVTGTDGNGVATVVCTWKKHRIYNCRIKFVYTSGRLVEISGKYASDVTMTDEKVSMSSSATALMHFLSAVRSDKYTCSAITAVEAGYYFVSAAYGEGRSNPVWRIETDTGVYYVDAVTGGIEQRVSET